MAAEPHFIQSKAGLAALALIAANIIWGGSAVATKAALDHLPPLTLACLRLAIALALLRPLLARTGDRPAQGRESMLLGLTGVALFCLFQNLGLRYVSAANTALISGGIPIMIAGLATLTLKERLGPRQCAGLLISLTGVTTIVLAGDNASLRVSLLANLLPLASAMSFAIYAVLGRRVFAERNALAVVTGSTQYGLLFLLPGAGLELALRGIDPPTLHDLLLLLYLGIGCSALAFVLCGYGLTRAGANHAAVLSNIKPLAGVILAISLLDEPVTTGQLASGALILTGVCLARPLTGQTVNRCKGRSIAVGRHGEARFIPRRLGVTAPAVSTAVRRRTDA